VVRALLTMQSRPRPTAPYPWLKPTVFVGFLTPMVALLLRAVRGELGANPISQALNQLGLVMLTRWAAHYLDSTS
jgi:hypothetical protein